MTSPPPGAGRPELSVVIPSYNSARWLPSTLAALAESVRRAGIRTEIIVVDDGSTDETDTVLARVPDTLDMPLTVISQANAGRFAARLRGVEAAGAPTVMLLDSRVLVDPESLRHVWASGDEGVRVWNGHIVTDPSARLVGRFWDVPTRIFWGDYLRDPRPIVLTDENFDSAPKGTTMLLAPRDVLAAAFAHSAPTVASPLVSDDTKLLRWVAGAHGIRLDPGFSAVYRPRTTVGGFLRHSLDRGTLFVDSYAGTSLLRSAILLGLTSAPLALAAAGVALLRRRRFTTVGAIAAVGVAAVSAPAVIASLQRTPRRSVLAYLVYILPFAGPFWAGLLRGVVVHRSAFLSPKSKEPTP